MYCISASLTLRVSPIEYPVPPLLITAFTTAPAVTVKFASPLLPPPPEPTVPTCKAAPLPVISVEASKTNPDPKLIEDTVNSIPVGFTNVPVPKTIPENPVNPILSLARAYPVPPLVIVIELTIPPATTTVA